MIPILHNKLLPLNAVEKELTSENTPSSFSVSRLIFSIVSPLFNHIRTWIQPPHEFRIDQNSLSLFATWLKNPSSPLPTICRSLCGHCFSSKSIAHLRATARIYNIQLTSLAPAQRFAAPIILRDITTHDIPWSALSAIIQTTPLSASQRQVLQKWISALQRSEDLLSSTLLFSVLEAAVQKTVGQHTEEQQSVLVFSLAEQLQEYGLSYTPRTGEPPLDDDISLHHFGDPLNIAIPTHLNITALSIPNSPHLMAITSPSPLYIGKFFSTYIEDKRLPYLPCHTLERRGHYVICDRIISSLAHYSWEDVETNRSVQQSIVQFIQQLLHMHKTPLLTENDLFLTSSHSVIVISTPRYRENFCLHTIEKLIHTLCKNDTNRIKDVYAATHIADHPATSWYSVILQEDMLYSPAMRINAVWLQMGLPKENLPKANKWISTLQGMHTIVTKKLCDTHIWKNTSSLALRKAFCQTIKAAQPYTFTIFSKNFEQHIIDTMNFDRQLLLGTLFIDKTK